VPDTGWPLPLAKPIGWQIDKAFRIAKPMRKALSICVENLISQTLEKAEKRSIS
jgi:hypothetical protein